MEYIVLIIVVIICIISLKIIFKININEIKELANNKELDSIAEKFPSNIEICKRILKKLKNETVKIEEEKNVKTSLYIAISNKIVIANLKGNYSRIQTIAHECLHSIQDRRILLFNFIFSNIYIIYFLIISFLIMINILPNKLMFICIYIILGLVFYVVRSYLENDAMIKARFLAKEYMEEEKIISEKEINKLLQGFDKINYIGIKYVNYNLIKVFSIRLLTILLICFIRTVAF